MTNDQEVNERATDAPLDNLLKAAKAVARHEQAHRQCVPSEHREILMRVGELFDLSDAVAAVEAAPAGAPALGEAEKLIERATRRADDLRMDYALAHNDRVLMRDLVRDLAAALRRPQAPASGEGLREAMAPFAALARVAFPINANPLREKNNLEAVIYSYRSAADDTDYRITVSDLRRLADCSDALSPSQPASGPIDELHRRAGESTL